jgi:cbb3-type cytochrome oxidase subunit 3
MKWLAIFLVIILLGQVILFFYSRQLKKEMKNSVIEKYNLKTPKDAWQAMADPDIPDEDRREIKRLYEGNEE